MNAKKDLMSLINAKVRTAPPEESFLIELKQTLSKLFPNAKGSTHYAPSSMQCDRSMYYKARGLDPDDVYRDSTNIRITQSGEDAHERIQYAVSQMREKGFDCDFIDVGFYVKAKGLDYLEIIEKVGFETKLFDKRYNLSFRCDGVIRFHGKYYILEIKTEIDYKNSQRKEADWHHRVQSICYSLSLGIDDIMWLYENRNIGAWKSYTTHITPQDKEEIITRICKVDSYVESGTLPPISEDPSACKYCDYRKSCTKNYNEFPITVENLKEQNNEKLREGLGEQSKGDFIKL